MKAALKTFLKSKLAITLLLIAGFVFLTFPKLTFYLRFDFNFLLLLIALPFVLKKQSDTKSIRYGIIAILLLLLFPILKVRSVFFFALVCTLLFIYEYQFGKLSSIPLFLVIIISPVAMFLSEVVGFEIRLWLTKIATNILQLVDGDYSHSGNIILMGTNEFHVDAACMGLKIVLLSLFIALIFISYQQQKKKRQIHTLFVVLSLMISYVLTVISNLFRIVILAIFQSAPETFSHELIGILCFIIYVVIPLWFILKLIPTQTSKRHHRETTSSHKFVFISLTLILFSVFTVYRFTDIGSKSTSKPDAISLDFFAGEFSSSIENHEVIKLINEDYLIYVKPAASFYAADHSPIVCWKGSGYEILKEQIISTPSHQVYYCELKKEEDILYSTWWYDSGDDKTILQYQWRFNNLMHGDQYHLVNVISDKKEDLITKTNALTAENIFGQPF